MTLIWLAIHRGWPCLARVIVKGFAVSICLWFVVTQASGQSAGDYRTSGAGTSWNVAANWQIFNGVTWGAAANYPGQIATPGTVTILSGQTMNANVTPAFSVGNITTVGSAFLDVIGGFTLTTSGALTIDGTSQVTGSNATSVLNAATLNVPVTGTNAKIGGLTMTISGATTIAGTLTINSDNGVKTFIGVVSNSGSWTSTSVVTTNNLVFRNGVSSTGTTFAAGTATFNTNAQAIGGTAAMSFANIVTVTGVLLTNNNTSTVTISSTGAGALTGTGSFTQGTNSTLSYSGSTIGIAAANFTATASGNTVNYKGATPTMLATSYYHLIYSGTTGPTVTTANVAGDLTVSSGSFSPTGTITFNNGTAAAQNINGPGTITFSNVTLNTATTAVNVNANIKINGTLTFSTNRILVIGSSANVTMGSGASITSTPGFSNSCYVQLDGSTGTNSNLIVTNNNTTAAWRIVYPIGTSSGGCTPLDFSAGSGASITTAPTNASTLSVKAIYNLSSQGQLRRVFRLTIVGNANATTFSNGVFNYNNTTDISTGDAESNYTTEWYLAASSASAAWTNINTIAAPTNKFTVAGGSAATASLTTGIYYYTIGQSSAYPNTWYSYQTGVWSNWQNWTSDPSGSSLVNGLNLPPQPGDAIVILNGITITNDVNGQVATTTTINNGGTLDMSITTGNNLGTVSGTGTLRIKGVALPTGTYTAFVTASTGGTIEYYDVTGTLPTSQTIYNNIKLSNSTASNIVFTETNNLTINGHFTISGTSTGTVTWQINDNTAAQRTITIAGDLTVGSKGSITAGTGNSGSTTPHSLTLSGNFTNSGTVNFFSPTSSPFTSAFNTLTAVTNANLQGNAVNVTFSGTSSNTVTCNGTTNFYRLVVNKGTGTNAVLHINSSSTSNFQLWGPQNQGSSGQAATDYSLCALSIINGTLELTGSIFIPTLIEDDTSVGGTSTDNWSLPVSGRLWLNGSNVTVYVTLNNNGNDDQRFNCEGVLQITSGTFNIGVPATVNGTAYDCSTKGLGSGAAGAIIVDGSSATLNMNQFRPRSGSASQTFSFSQSAGLVNCGTNATGTNGTVGTNMAQANTGYSSFDIASTGSTFQMTGGTLNVGQPTSNAPGGIEILSSSTNYFVTGGTINAYIPSTGNNFTISSTAPFYNFNVYREGTTSALTASITAALTVLNNFAIITGNSPTFSTGANSLTIGGNFTVNSGTTFTSPTSTANPITFNGSSAQTLTNNGTISALTNTTLVVNKTGTLTLAGTTSPVLPANLNTLTLSAGTLADGGSTITVTTGLTNNATHSGAGNITYSGTAAIGGNNGTFGNLLITAANSTVATSGNQTITGNLQLNGTTKSILNIASNSLTVNGTITSSVGLGHNSYIQTSGLHNAGGLTRPVPANTNVVFPVGISTFYSPNTINVNNATTYGTVTVRPVNSEHPNVTTTAISLKYYWRVTSSGFTLGASPAVTHRTYQINDGTAGATYGASTVLTNCVAARYDRTANSWGRFSGAGQTMATKILPDPFNTGTSWTISGDKLDGEYTCGNSGAFGAFNTYYSRTSGAWNDVTTVWSTTAVGGAACSCSPTACATCPVIIGDGATNNHTITIDANSRTCGSLTLSSGSTLDCSTFTSLNFGTSTGSSVTGTGTLRINSANFPAGDFTDFLGSSGGTVEWYGTTKTIPTTGPAPQTLSLATYYNLVINPSAANTITLPASNLTIYNNMTQGGTAGFTGTTVTNGSRTISITGNFAITLGTFNFSNANPSVTTLTVSGSTTVGNGATLQAQSGGTANVNTFSTPGSITNNGTINFRNTALVNLTFAGSNNVTFGGTGSGGTTLNLVTVNKGSSQTPSVIFNVGGTVTTTAVAAGWLTLTNGTFDWENSSATTISTSSYNIPSTGQLKCGAGTVNITSNAGGTNDLFLTGALQVAGGAVNTTSSGAPTDCDIEYASVGTPTITVSSGSLTVAGSVRRSTITLTGALVYNQTGGSVTVQGHSSNNTRGVFEIEANTGSSFTLTGVSSTLTIQRTMGSTASYTDVYINPLSSTVGSTSTIAVGLNGAAQSLSVNIVPTIGNFTVVGGTSAQTVSLYSNPLSVGGSLTINSPSSLVTRSLNVSIAGDLSINGTGTYIGGTSPTSLNTTTFNGTAAQTATLSSGSTFYNMTVNNTGGATVQLSNTSTAPTLTNLNILSGIFDVNNLALNVNGDMTNNSSQVASGGGSITVTTTTTSSHTITSSGGSFTNLKIGGATAATNNLVTVSGNMTMNGYLDFVSTSATRTLFIGSNLLTLNSAATILNAGTTSFIKTNGVSSDLGVTKVWPVGTNSFTYAVGTRTNYTPVTFTSLAVTTQGNYNVVPVDAAHPTSNPTGPQILDYYWKVIKDNTLTHNSTGSLVLTVPTSLIGGSGGTLLGAYLNAITLVGWTAATAPDGISVAGSNTLLTFSNNDLNTVLPGLSGEFDYTYGTTTTLPNPITPVYSRFADADQVSNPTSVGNSAIGGSWASASSWTLSSTGYGAALSSAPTNRPVVILAQTSTNPAARINLDILGQSAFTTQLMGGVGAFSSGLLVVTTPGHNIGSISGSGTMRTTTSTLPAGTYTTFTASGGGTIEYSAAISMNSRSTYNNLLISSIVSMTATNLTVNGNLTIGSGSTLDNAANNADINLAGNWSNSGTFNAGTGTVTFNGTTAQSITGPTTFNNLTINNSFSTSPQITMSGGNDVVSSTLTLSQGNINLNSQNLTIGTDPSSPGALNHSLSSSAGWVYGGNLVRYFGTSAISDGSVTGFFPMGTSSDFRPFFIGVPAGDMITGGSFTVSNVASSTVSSVSISDPTDPASPIVGQSQAYWTVSSSGVSGGTYDLIAGGTGWIVGNLADLSLCKATSVVGTYSIATNTTSDPRLVRTGLSLTDLTTTDGSNFYVGSTNLTTSPLPIELLSFTGTIVTGGVELNWHTANEVNNSHFIVLRATDGTNFEPIGTVVGNGTTNVPHSYSLFDRDPSLGKNYYRLKQVDFDGRSSFSEVIMVMVQNIDPLVSIYPNPVSQHQPLNVVLSGLPSNTPAEILIMNSQGVKVGSSNVEVDATGTLRTSIVISSLTTGVYILKVENNYFKVVIE